MSAMTMQAGDWISLTGSSIRFNILNLISHDLACCTALLKLGRAVPLTHPGCLLPACPPPPPPLLPTTCLLPAWRPFPRPTLLTWLA